MSENKKRGGAEGGMCGLSDVVGVGNEVISVVMGKGSGLDYDNDKKSREVAYVSRRL